MIQDDIIRMAHQAGDDWDSTLPEDKAFLERFAALVAAAEREACADTCEQLIGTHAMAKHCADAIRARGQA